MKYLHLIDEIGLRSARRKLRENAITQVCIDADSPLKSLSCFFEFIVNKHLKPSRFVGAENLCVQYKNHAIFNHERITESIGAMIDNFDEDIIFEHVILYEGKRLIGFTLAVNAFTYKARREIMQKTSFRYWFFRDDEKQKLETVLQSQVCSVLEA